MTRRRRVRQAIALAGSVAAAVWLAAPWVVWWLREHRKARRRRP